MLSAWRASKKKNKTKTHSPIADAQSDCRCGYNVFNALARCSETCIPADAHSPDLTVRSQGWQAFAAKGQTVIIQALCCGLSLVTTIPPCHERAKVATGNTHAKERGSVPIKLYLWALKSGLHVIIVGRRILFCFLFSSAVTNI